jgi:transposase-like protein
VAVTSKKSNRTVSRIKKKILLCPKKHVFKKHRRRNGKYQYFCKECNLYYTVPSQKPRIAADNKIFDFFLQKYIRGKMHNHKVSVATICKDKNVKISRASVYRYLFTKDGIQEINLILKICIWIRKKLGVDYEISIEQRKLKIKYKKRSATLRVTFDVKCVDDLLKITIIPDKVLFRYWPNLSQDFINTNSFIEFDYLNENQLTEKLPELKICIDKYLMMAD